MDQQQWFEQVYQQYGSLLLRIGRRLLSGQDEELLYDAIQEVFLTLWDKRDTLMDHPNIGGWLVEAIKFRIRGSQAKITRRALRHAYSLDEENAAPLEDAASLTPEQHAVLESRIEQLCALLGPENASLFLDYTLRGYSAKDLSGIYGISESCVWMRISRIKKKLVALPEVFCALLTLMTALRSLNA